MSARQFEQLVPAPVSGLTSANSGLMESPSSARYAATHGATGSSDLSGQFHCLPSYIDNDDGSVGRKTRLGQDSPAQNIDGLIDKEMQLPIALWTESSVYSPDIEPRLNGNFVQGQSSMGGDGNKGPGEGFPKEDSGQDEEEEEGWLSSDGDQSEGESEDESEDEGEDESEDESEDEGEDESEEESEEESEDVVVEIDEGYHRDDWPGGFSIDSEIDPVYPPTSLSMIPESPCSIWMEQDVERLNGETPYVPTQRDVKLVQDILAHFFAIELVKLILDEAEYWPALTCTTGIAPREVEARFNSTLLRFRANYCYYITPRLPSPAEGILFKVRKIVFRLWSHDQGWTTDTTGPEPYSGAKTWFEAAIFRGLGGDEINGPDEVARRINGASTQNASVNVNIENAAPDEAFQVPNPWRSDSKVWQLQRNARAWWDESLYEITWTDEDDSEKKENTKQVLKDTGTGWGYGFVRQLKPGDRIAIYARARDACWVNYIRAVEIRMYYSV